MRKLSTVEDLFNRPILEALVELDKTKWPKQYPYSMPTIKTRKRGEGSIRREFNPETGEYTAKNDPKDIIDLPAPTTARKYAGHDVYAHAADEQDVQYFMLQRALLNLGLIPNIHRSRRVNVNPSNVKKINKIKDIVLSLFDKIKISDNTSVEDLENIFSYSKSKLDEIAGFNIRDLLFNARRTKSGRVVPIEKAWDNLIGNRDEFDKLLAAHIFVNQYRSKEIHHDTNLDIRRSLEERDWKEREQMAKKNGQVTESFGFTINKGKLILEADEEDDDFEDLSDDDLEELEDDGDINDDYEEKSTPRQQQRNRQEVNSNNKSSGEVTGYYPDEAYIATPTEKKEVARKTVTASNTLYPIFKSVAESGTTPLEYLNYITAVDGILSLINTPMVKANIGAAIENEKRKAEELDEKFTVSDYKTAILVGLQMSISGDNNTQQVSNVIARKTTAALYALVRRFKQLGYEGGLTLDNVFKYIKTSDDPQATEARENLKLFYNLSPGDLDTKNFKTFGDFAEGLYKNDKELAQNYQLIKKIFGKETRKGAIAWTTKAIDRARNAILSNKEKFLKRSKDIESGSDLDNYIQLWNDNKLKIGQNIGNVEFTGFVPFSQIAKFGYPLPAKLEELNTAEQKKTLPKTMFLDFSGFTKGEVSNFVSRAAEKWTADQIKTEYSEVINPDYMDYFNNQFIPQLEKDLKEGDKDAYNGIRKYIREYIVQKLGRLKSSKKHSVGKTEDIEARLKEFDNKLNALNAQFSKVSGRDIDTSDSNIDFSDDDRTDKSDPSNWPSVTIKVIYNILTRMRKRRRDIYVNARMRQVNATEIKQINLIMEGIISSIDDIFAKAGARVKSYLKNSYPETKFDFGLGSEMFDEDDKASESAAMKTISNPNSSDEDIEEAMSELNRLFKLHSTYYFVIRYPENSDFYGLLESEANNVMESCVNMFKNSILTQFTNKFPTLAAVRNPIAVKLVDGIFKYNDDYSDELDMIDSALGERRNKEEDEEVLMACSELKKNSIYNKNKAKEFKSENRQMTNEEKRKDILMREAWKQEYMWNRYGI